MRTGKRQKPLRIFRRRREVVQLYNDFEDRSMNPKLYTGLRDDLYYCRWFWWWEEDDEDADDFFHTVLRIPMNEEVETIYAELPTDVGDCGDFLEGFPEEDGWMDTYPNTDPSYGLHHDDLDAWQVARPFWYLRDSTAFEEVHYRWPRKGPRFRYRILQWTYGWIRTAAYWVGRRYVARFWLTERWWWLVLFIPVLPVWWQVAAWWQDLRMTWRWSSWLYQKRQSLVRTSNWVWWTRLCYWNWGCFPRVAGVVKSFAGFVSGSWLGRWLIGQRVRYVGSVLYRGFSAAWVWIASILLSGFLVVVVAFDVLPMSSWSLFVFLYCIWLVPFGIWQARAGRSRWVEWWQWLAAFVLSFVIVGISNGVTISVVNGGLY